MIHQPKKTGILFLDSFQFYPTNIVHLCLRLQKNYALVEVTVSDTIQGPLKGYFSHSLSFFLSFCVKRRLFFDRFIFLYFPVIMMDIEMALFHTLTNVFSLEITDFVYNRNFSSQTYA
jgi:hypothetical protein